MDIASTKWSKRTFFIHVLLLPEKTQSIVYAFVQPKYKKDPQISYKSNLMRKKTFWMWLERPILGTSNQVDKCYRII